MRTAEIDSTPFVLAAVLLLGLLAQALLHATPIPSTPTARPRPESAKAAYISPAADLPTYAGLLQFPLFSTVPAGGGGAADIAPPGSFTLLGLVKAGAQASVVIRSGDAAIHAVKLGQVILGWRLMAAGGGRALLVRDGVSQTLVLGAPPRATPPSLQPGERP